MRKSNNHRECVLICGMSTHGKSNFANELAYNYNRVVIMDPLNEYDGKYLYTPRRIEQHMEDSPIFRIATNSIIKFDEVCGLVMKHASPMQRITLMIDEITRLEFDQKLNEFPNFKNIVYGGGHEHVDLIAVTQRFSDFPKALRAAAWTRIVAFCQTDEDDLRRLKKITSRETAEEIAKLQPRNYISITNQKIERGHT